MWLNRIRAWLNCHKKDDSVSTMVNDIHPQFTLLAQDGLVIVVHNKKSGLALLWDSNIDSFFISKLPTVIHRVQEVNRNRVSSIYKNTTQTNMVHIYNKFLVRGI